MFRELTENEKTKFKQWARENYKPFTPINGIWHIVIQNECTLMNKEKSGMIFNATL